MSAQHTAALATDSTTRLCHHGQPLAARARAFAGGVTETQLRTAGSDGTNRHMSQMPTGWVPPGFVARPPITYTQPPKETIATVERSDGDPFLGSLLTGTWAGAAERGGP